MARISKTHLRKLKILLKRLRSNVLDHEQIYPCSWPFSSLIDATSDELIVIEKLLKGEQGDRIPLLEMLPHETAEDCEIRTLEAEVARLTQQLGDLVCLLCRDGGQTISELGMEEAIKQAESNYGDLGTAKDEVTRLRKALIDLVDAIEVSSGYEREELHTWKAFTEAKKCINPQN